MNWCLCFQVLAALASHGVVYFMNVLSCKMMFTIGNREQMIDNFTISNNGWYMACGMESGRVNMYRCDYVNLSLGHRLMHIEDFQLWHIYYYICLALHMTYIQRLKGN